MTVRGWFLVLLAAAAGRVVDPEGRPIAGAEACWGRTEQECVKTDSEGFYRIEHPTTPAVFVRATGFVGVETEAGEHVAPITLRRAATLTIRVVDAATGRPIPAGVVKINYTSGQSVGSSAPFNSRGVRITTLIPGEILARAEAQGYRPGGPEVVVLEGGAEKTLTIGMRRLSDAPAPR